MSEFTMYLNMLASQASITQFYYSMFQKTHHEFHQTREHFINGNNFPHQIHARSPDIFASQYNPHLDFPLPSENQIIETKKPKKREKNLEKELMSAKKNSQSNIINQFFSFFSVYEKSSEIVLKAIKFLDKSKEQENIILRAFYSLIKFINMKRGRKYINRMILQNFFTPELVLKYFPEFDKTIVGLECVTMEEICQVFRRCCQKFFRTICILSLLTSKRISSLSKQEHLGRRRRITKSINSAN